MASAQTPKLSEISSEDKQLAVETLRHRIKDEVKKVKNINTDDEYLLRFLYSCDFDIEIAFTRMRDYHETMVESPNWYQRGSITEIQKEMMSKNAAAMISACDKEGRPIYISRLGNLDPDKTTFADEACIDDIWYEYILDKHPEVAGKGVCMILDFEGITWKYIKMLTYKDVKLSFRRLASLPFKEFKLHVVNNSRYMRMMLKVVKPFIPEDSKKQLHFHLDDWESLYKFIDKDNLPPEYGGYNKINYKKLYEKLYEKDDTIAKNFTLYRSVVKT